MEREGSEKEKLREERGRGNKKVTAFRFFFKFRDNVMDLVGIITHLRSGLWNLP